MKKVFSILFIVFLASCASAPIEKPALTETKPSYGNESPIDPYVMHSEWRLKGENHCGYIPVAELAGEYVFACYLFNPDDNAKWPTGVIGVALDANGNITDKILIFSICDQHDNLQTYILEGGNYVLLEIRNVNYAPINIHAAQIMRLCDEVLETDQTEIDAQSLVRSAYKNRISMKQLIKTVKLEYAKHALEQTETISEAARSLNMARGSFWEHYRHLRDKP